jgi:hypothetical protein
LRASSGSGRDSKTRSAKCFFISGQVILFLNFC